MTKTVAQTYTEKLEAAYITIDTRHNQSEAYRAIENRADFVAYVANDVFQVAADRAQAAGVELPAEQMQVMEAAAVRLAGRDAEFWAAHSTGFTSRSADWGKLLMAEVRS